MAINQRFWGVVSPPNYLFVSDACIKYLLKTSTHLLKKKFKAAEPYLPIEEVYGGNSILLTHPITQLGGGGGVIARMRFKNVRFAKHF